MYRIKYPWNISYSLFFKHWCSSAKQSLKVEFLSSLFPIKIFLQIYRLRHPENYLFLSSKNDFVGSKYLKKKVNLILKKAALFDSIVLSISPCALKSYIFSLWAICRNTEKSEASHDDTRRQRISCLKPVDMSYTIGPVLDEFCSYGTIQFFMLSLGVSRFYGLSIQLSWQAVSKEAR